MNENTQAQGVKVKVINVIEITTSRFCLVEFGSSMLTEQVRQEMRKAFEHED